MQKKYTVTGMRCAGCAANLENAIRVLPGISSVSVSFPAHRMDVSIEGIDIPDSVIIRKGAELGFTVETILSAAEEKRRILEQDLNEHRELHVRFRFSILFLIPLLALQFMPGTENVPSLTLIIAFLLAGSIVYVNRTIFLRGFRQLLRRAPDMDSLVALGAAASFGYSFYLAVRQIVFGAESSESTSEICFESSAMILTLITLGRLLESGVRKKTTGAVNELMELLPETAVVKRNGQELEIPEVEIQVGDLVVIRPGRRIPADGRIVSGSSSVDQAFLTGESIPAVKKSGDSVFSGTLNRDGYFEFIVQKKGSETILAGIIELVRNALGSKAPIARLADRVCAVFVPIVIAAAILAGFGQVLLGAKLSEALSTAIAVLVISCPCALGLATPLAVAAGTGRAARDGILIKSAQTFELLNRLNIVVFDKTGTVTEGRPQLTDIIIRSEIENINNYDTDQEAKEKLVKSIGAIEFSSDHPLAQAIREYAVGNGIRLTPGPGAETIPGEGLRARLNGREFLIGSERLMTKANIDLTEFRNSIDHNLNNGASVLFVAINDQLEGILVFSDRLKSGSRETIDSFKTMGLETVLLSGDNKKTVEAAARTLGVDQFFAEVLPNEKETIVRNLQERGTVAMIGDGINDAPALARADVGMAVASGANIAIDSAQVILTAGKPLEAVSAVQLGRKTVRIIKENLFWAFVYNIVGIPLAAGLFIPVFGWRLDPVYAAAAMGLSSLCVVLNSLRILKNSSR